MGNSWLFSLFPDKVRQIASLVFDHVVSTHVPCAAVHLSCIVFCLQYQHLKCVPVSGFEVVFVLNSSPPTSGQWPTPCMPLC